jgi:hypothetical protein
MHFWIDSGILRSKCKICLFLQIFSPCIMDVVFSCQKFKKALLESIFSISEQVTIIHNLMLISDLK